jgi:DHA1 family bicyclomycin/chloramphenicol resistance-like MFS transporter
MYLPSMPLLERFFSATTAQVQWTLATYFLGFAFGQTLFGPLTDRFGRKPPLYCSLLLYFTASVGCALAPSIQAMSAFRLLQAVGACGGAVIARAMVRDMFPPLETRRAFSTLIMINGVGPAVAPLIGGFLLLWFGWQSIFWFLAGWGCIGMLIARFRLPESLHPSRFQPLNLRHIFGSYGMLLRDRTFLGASLVTGLSSAGLFSYVAGAPFVFINVYNLTPQRFSWIFGINALGIILASNISARFLQAIPADRILKAANLIQLASGLTLVAVALTRVGGVFAIWVPLFCYVSTIGLTFPNGSALAMASHAKIAGIASALLGTNQFALAVVATTLLGAIASKTALPMAALILTCATVATSINFLLLNRRPELAAS